MGVTVFGETIKGNTRGKAKEARREPAPVDFSLIDIRTP
jgi:hypothetical protein